MKVSFNGSPSWFFGILEAYLPAKDSPPSLYPWDVYAELRKVKFTKATGPDGISPKLVKEFAYELSSPLTDILNCSYKGVVPKQWKQAIVVPIPKTKPPRVDKLRPVSLTDCSAKIGEGFVTNWVLEDIQDKIDPQQFGNIKGISTSHYLVSLLHSLHHSGCWQGQQHWDGGSDRLLKSIWYDWPGDWPQHPHWEIYPFGSLQIYCPLVVWLCQQPSPMRSLQSSNLRV